MISLLFAAVLSMGQVIEDDFANLVSASQVNALTVRTPTGKLWPAMRTGPTEVRVWCPNHSVWNTYRTDGNGTIVCYKKMNCPKVMPTYSLPGPVYNVRPTTYCVRPTTTTYYYAPSFQGRYGAYWSNHTAPVYNTPIRNFVGGVFGGNCSNGYCWR